MGPNPRGAVATNEEPHRAATPGASGSPYRRDQQFKIRLPRGGTVGNSEEARRTGIPRRFQIALDHRQRPETRRATPGTWDPKTPHLPGHPGYPIEGAQGPKIESPRKRPEKIPRRPKGAGERGGSRAPSNSTNRADPIPQSTNTSTRGTSRTSTKIRVPSPTEPKNSYVGVRERAGRALSTPRHRDLPVNQPRRGLPIPRNPRPPSSETWRNGYGDPPTT